MNVNLKIAGLFGTAAGIGLLVEAALWTLSGWTPATFADPAAAMRFLAEDGTVLRAAVFAGFVNLALFVVLVIGMSDALRPRTPLLAAATLWFGMIGITTHLLVPMAHWYGTPAFVRAAAESPTAAQSAWTAFVTVGHDAAGGAGSLFLGVSMLTAGWAIVARHALPTPLGWLGLVTGVTTVLTVFSPDTPLSGMAGALFLPSLALAVVFRIWSGVALIRVDRGARVAT